MQQKIIRILIAVCSFFTIAIALSSSYAVKLTAQTYNEECKEDLRDIMRYGANWRKLGLELTDTASWYDNENWVSKITNAEILWTETNSKLRIKLCTLNIYPTDNAILAGKFKLSSPYLVYLDCSNHSFRELDVSQNINLEELYCYNIPVTKLDISNNTKLKTLGCAGMINVSELDFSKNTELLVLNYEYNNLVKLDLSKNTKLEDLNCSYNNKITELYFLENANLKNLKCNKMNLVKLDISKNVKLEFLDCSSNKLTELYVNNNTELCSLFCSSNNLTELNISKNTKLTTLNCNNNNLAELNISNNVKLCSLSCSFNNLTKLDATKNIELQHLICVDNNLTELKIDKNSQSSLTCFHNFLMFSALPIINSTNYFYTPQKTIKGGIKKYTDTVDLSKEYNINANTTNYQWSDVTTYIEKEITQPTNKNGVFSFTSTHADKRLLCRMTNIQFPYLTLIYEVEMGEKIPSIYHEDCKEDLRAFMRQGDNWKFLLSSQDTKDTASWYDNEEWVERIPGISWGEYESMARIDSINWYSIFKYDTIIGKLKLRSPILKYLNTGDNYISIKLDVSSNTELEFLDCSNNNLSNIDINNNTKLKHLICANNDLNEINVKHNSELEFLDCKNNNLPEIDIKSNAKLKYLNCSGNKLKFSTLPMIELPSSNVTGFYYAPQDTIEGGNKDYTHFVDLSSEYEINGNITTYKWFDITEIIEEQIEEPINNKGVFYFTEAYKDRKLRCKMRNSQFPAGNVSYWLKDTFTLVLEIHINDVGIIDNSIVKHFTILKNPTSSDVVINFGLLESGKIKIEVVDLLGNMFYTTSNFYNAGEQTINLNTKNIPNGSYICRMLMKNKQIGVKNFIMAR